MKITLLTPDLLIQYKKSYFDTLSALVVSTPLPDTVCQRMLGEITTQGGSVFVAIDEDQDQIVGTISVYCLRHLLRGGVMTAHIEEICVHADYQGQGIGSLLLTQTIDHAKSVGCYKAILNCEEHNVGWYEKFGFEKKEIEMKMYL